MAAAGAAAVFAAEARREQSLMGTRRTRGETSASAVAAMLVMATFGRLIGGLLRTVSAMLVRTFYPFLPTDNNYPELALALLLLLLVRRLKRLPLPFSPLLPSGRSFLRRWSSRPFRA